MNKKTIISLFLALIVLAGCGNTNSSAGADINLYDMQKAMVDAGESFPNMITVNNNDTDAKKNFGYISDMDYSKINGYFLSYSSDGLADEIVVIRTSSGNDTKEALESLKAHMEDRIKLYDQYEPEQAVRARNGRTFSKGNYAVLVISEDYEKIKAAFDGMF